jgi:predicted dithiol-disulfide oxidoreductase (DUF899 family)
VRFHAHAHTRGWRYARLLWAALDCTPEGRGADWMPQFEYRA